jgi:hypothetical protein
MVQTSVRYIVYNHGGSGVRHHHFSAQNDIISEAPGSASPGDALVAQAFPFQIYMGQTVPFAFMSVHGAADGNHLYTSPGNENLTVGQTDIDVLVVYAPPGGIGGPNGGPGVWVDAFNVDTGDFSDDLNFIEVLTPPTPPDAVDGAQTAFANQEGVVSTLNAENLRASPSVDGGVPFLEWKMIVPSETLDYDKNVDLQQNETGEIWLAFYGRRPSLTGLVNVGQLLEGGIFVWTGDDTCGNGGHWIPGHVPGGGGPFRLQISDAILRALSPQQQREMQTLIKEYPAIAGSALAAMTKMLNVLSGAQNILEAGNAR